MGHASDRLREAFVEYLGSGRIPLDDFPELRAQFLEMFEECTDTMEHSDCDMIGIAPGSSYAEAVEHVR